MILLDTHAIVFDALAPERMTRRAARAIERAADERALACSDISLWEIAMLATKRRLDLGTQIDVFLDRAIQARAIEILPIDPRIASLAQADMFAHGDPADRIIGATALHRKAILISADQRLRAIKALKVIW
ncbi:MAG TPA: type II toxin-antitoxin system VapC family toxin [Burkholderiales bacterium]|nr:type II toxin-antitoxin system VapC family toxin [Burkholderiales bacterium]